ncbi:hypothetical protein BGP_3437 [Beggiatoa sp. PS]|nr:hypothetical protein BGP_3437 [Beggiatoa sp. PS]
MFDVNDVGKKSIFKGLLPTPTYHFQHNIKSFKNFGYDTISQPNDLII